MLADYKAENVIRGNTLTDFFQEKLVSKEIDSIIDDNDDEMIVEIDGYELTIDKSIPKILEDVYNANKNDQIKIEVTVAVTPDFAKGKLNIKITYEEDISTVTINGEEVTLGEKVNGVYIIEKEVNESRIYSIIAKDKEGRYNIGKIKVTDITQDMEIRNKEDMITFREKVNEGRTFEGRTVKLVNNINLEGNSENEWEPIKKFSGTFDGNYKTISGIYINDKSNNGIIKGCYNKGTIYGNEWGVGGITGYNAASNHELGIQGQKQDAEKRVGYVINCYNNASVKCGSGRESFCGGVVGRNNYYTEDKRGTSIGYIYNVYSVNTTNVIGDNQGVVQNYYTTDVNTNIQALNAGIDDINEIYETNGKDTFQPWIEDANNTNDGYPILEWQLEM